MGLLWLEWLSSCRVWDFQALSLIYYEASRGEPRTDSYLLGAGLFPLKPPLDSV